MKTRRSSSRFNWIQVAEASFWVRFFEYSCSLVLFWVVLELWRLTRLYVLVGLLATFAPLAFVTGVAIFATLVCAPAFRVAVTALVEVWAANLLGEDIYYIMLLAWNGTRCGDPLKKVRGASVILLLLNFLVLGLCWKFLEKPSVYFALIKLVSAGTSIFGWASRLNLRVVFASWTVVLRLSIEQKLSRCNSLSNSAHFTTLIKQSETFSLVLTILSMSNLP